MTAATAAALPVASTTTTSSFESCSAKAANRSRRMSTRPSRSELAVIPRHRLGEGAVDIQSDDAHACSLLVLARSKRELAGNTTPTDPRSQRIRESRKGRPCNELGLSAHCLSAACPHLRAPGAPRPRWAHHKAAPQKRIAGREGTAGHIPDNGIVERFIRTFKEQVVHGRIYQTIDDVRDAVRSFVARYNAEWLIEKNA